jgi:glutathione synthase/RimK-type ligase-like ATP-grasp enzyme
MPKKRCAFLTMDNTEGWSIDADLAIAPLQARNWQIDWVPWRSPDVDWDRYDAVYIGTPWDYPEDVSRFIGVLERIDRSAAVLVNDLALVRWGIPKTYLRDLEARGAAIVPSLWHEHLSAGQLSSFFEALSVDHLVIKPVVSTNATDTFLLDRDEASAMELRLLGTFSNRAFVVQPFIENIRKEGEYSLFYFGGNYSHAIRKVPKALDFRVQEEHGANIVAAQPDASLVDCADAIMGLVEPLPVYARCDLVRGADGRFLLMELELIEPSMYLRMHADAPERFAAEFDRYVSAVKG